MAQSRHLRPSAPLAIPAWTALAVLGVWVCLDATARAQSDLPPPGKSMQDSQGEGKKPDSVEQGAPDLSKYLAGRVTDRKGIPPYTENNPPDEAKAYCWTLIQARETPASLMAKSARHDVLYVNLFEEPEKYRGQVIHFQGKLYAVRKMEPPKYVRGETYGINASYEAWIFDKELRGANPVVVVITDLPQDVAVGEQMDIPVAFDAYFFKRYRYVAGDGTRDCPMLIGRTLQVLAPATAVDDGSMLGFTSTLVIVLLSAFVVTASLAVLLSWLYRRQDRRVRALVANSRQPSFEDESMSVEANGAAPMGNNGHARIDEQGGYPNLRNQSGNDWSCPD